MLSSYLKPDAEKLRLAGLKVPVAGYTKEMTVDTASTISTIPQIYYYSIPIPTVDIEYCYINDTGFMPTISMSFTDTTNILTDAGYPSDDAIISVVVPSRSLTIASIRMDFKIMTYNIDPTGSDRSISLTGVISVDGLYLRQYKSYSESCTWDVLMDIAKDNGLGMLSNISTTNDVMNWVNPGKPVHEFITNSVVPYGWVGESGFVWTFIDLFYNLNYVDIEAALAVDARDRKGVSITTGMTAVGDGEEKMTDLILSNDAVYSTSNMYFVSPEVINQSTKVSIHNGYRKNYYAYDVFGNWENKAGMFQQFTIDSITTPGAETNSLIMKAKPGDSKFFENNVAKHYFGAFDTDNVHSNYGYASIQNAQNIAELQKISINITMPNPNLELRRFDKVLVLFANNKGAADGRAVNERMTGQWLITGITFIIENGQVLQKLTLVKRELNVMDQSQ